MKSTAAQYDSLSVDTIANALSYVSADCDRETWWKMAAAIKSELGQDGFSIWDDWSKTGASYNARDAKDTWKSSHGTGGVGIGSLIYEAQRNGFKFDSKPKEITAEEREARKAKRAADAAKELADMQRKQKLAAQIAKQIWDKAEPVTYNFHPYHNRKGIMFGGDVRIGEYPRWTPDGIITIQNALLIPIRNKLGELTSLQAIFPDAVPELGRDRDYLPNGVKQGSFFTLGEPSDVLYICEGYATGCTIHEAMDAMTVVAFDRSNLIEVGKIMRDLYPDAKIVIAADNDQFNKRGNDGLTSAQKAGAACGAVLRVPQFKDLSEKPTDFNDLERLEGMQAVISQLNAADPVPANDNDPAAAPELMPELKPPAQNGYIDFHSPLPMTNSKGKPISTIENMEEILDRLSLVVRYNVIKKEIETLIPSEQFSVDNRAEASLARIISRCNEFNFPVGQVSDFLTYIADQNIYNPVATWIGSKPWDGVPRLTEFANTITPADEKKLPDGTPFHHALIRRWLISAVAAAFEGEGVSAHGVLVLQGDQNMGKTKWFKSLAPAELDVLQDGLMLRTDDRDSVKQVVSFWLVELGELDATFKRSDIAALKAFLTRKNDVLRRPYARAESNYARRTVFFGSVNPRQFLHDPTGNRRYWTIPCAAINHTHGMDMQQVWAEVLELYRNGETWYLTDDEMKTLNDSNEDFEAIDTIQEQLSAHLNWSEVPQHWKWRTATEVLQSIGIQKPQNHEAKTASEYLKKRGCQTKRSANGRLLNVPPAKKLDPVDPISNGLGW